MTESKKKRSGALGLIILSLVILINPTVKVVDIFPDFIACLIIVKYLTHAADRAPYFEEARLAFIRLGIISVAKIPAFFLIAYARGSNVHDYDTAVLFTLVFTAIETFLLVTAVNDLFSGAFYLGERSDASSLIKPFALNKKGTRLMSPEALRILTFVFIGVREAFCLLPEMLLLTQSEDPGKYVQVFRPMKYYPYAIVLAVFLAFVFSIYYARRACAYLRAVSREGKFTSAADSLITGEKVAELEKKTKIKKIKAALSIFVAASFFTVELCFDNFAGANLIPHFIFGALLAVALVNLRHHSPIKPVAYVLSGIYCAVSTVAYVLQIRFIDEHGYDALVKGELAKDAYLPVIISSIIEFLVISALLVVIAISIRELIYRHTGVSPESERYSQSDRDYHRSTVIRCGIWAALGILAALSKISDVVLKYYSSLTLVAVDDGIGNVVSGLVPWFNLVVLATALIYIGYTFYFLSYIKEEIELKYTLGLSESDLFKPVTESAVPKTKERTTSAD